MEHKLAYTEVKSSCYSAKIDDRSHLVILTQYVFDVSVWLTEYSVTPGLRVGWLKSN